MSTPPTNAKDIFLEAVEHHAPHEWPQFLDSACGGDANLRQRVEVLLAAHDRGNRLLDASGPVATIDIPTSSDLIGTQIGPYKVREQIGEGGMGEVFVAEQVRPVRRKVALKIIRPGMATKDVIARFEAERQALAMMDHPNIAKVFDAGSVGQTFQAAVPNDQPTADGERPAGIPDPQLVLPYFVMELVQGVPITEYCDAKRVTNRERLQLFLSVCRAVQHAHQKGIIHRDLKPSNVLVPEIDGAAVPKVIDFGVVKAVSQKLTERTVYTRFTQMIGTPMYMSPEQAGLGVVDVDTRSDIYSLGVLLYELLTGTTPFDRETLREASFEEMQRIIREEEPRRPSAQVSTLSAEALTTVAARRGTDPRKLRDTLRGELDWIVMRCLEKDRTRRYETAADLTRDVERFLADEPVHARPPSRVYRAKKFARKHRVALGAAASTASAAAAGIVVAIFGFATAVNQRDIAADNLQRGLVLIDQAIYPTFDAITYPPELQQHRDRLLDRTIEFFESLDVQAFADPRARYSWARAYSQRAFFRSTAGSDATSDAQRAIDLLLPLHREYPLNATYACELAQAYSELARGYEIAGAHRRAASELNKAIATVEGVAGAHPFDANILARHIRMAGLAGACLKECGRFSEAQNQFRTALRVADSRNELKNAVSEPLSSFAEMTVRARYGTLLIEMGRYAEAVAQLREAQRLSEYELGRASNESQRMLLNFWLAVSLSSIASVDIVQGAPERALEKLRHATRILEGQARSNAPSVWGDHQLGHAYFIRGTALTQLGRPHEALSAYEAARSHWSSSGLLIDLEKAAWADVRIGELLWELGQPDASQARFVAALDYLTTTIDRLPDEPAAREMLVILLCIWPDAATRDPARATQLAEQSLRSGESSGLRWRCLGLARYRAGAWAGAEQAIKKGMDLRNGGDAIDWLLLAAVQHQAERREEAKAYFQHAENLIALGQPVYYGHVGVVGYRQLRDEIDSLLQRQVSGSQNIR